MGCYCTYFSTISSLFASSSTDLFFPQDSADVARVVFRRRRFSTWSHELRFPRSSPGHTSRTRRCHHKMRRGRAWKERISSVKSTPGDIVVPLPEDAGFFFGAVRAGDTQDAQRSRTVRGRNWCSPLQKLPVVRNFTQQKMSRDCAVKERVFMWLFKDSRGSLPSFGGLWAASQLWSAWLKGTLTDAAKNSVLSQL